MSLILREAIQAGHSFRLYGSEWWEGYGYFLYGRVSLSIGKTRTLYRLPDVWALRPECTSETVVKYIRDYMVKGTSGEGYGRRIFDLPHLLLVHLPEAGRIGRAEGWDSPAYRKGLQSVDRAMTSILDIYKDIKLFDRTTVFVTSITNDGNQKPGSKASRVPWMAWGAGVKPGHSIKEPVTLLDTGATVMRTLG